MTTHSHLRPSPTVAEQAERRRSRGRSLHVLSLAEAASVVALVFAAGGTTAALWVDGSASALVLGFFAGLALLVGAGASVWLGRRFSAHEDQLVQLTDAALRHRRAYLRAERLEEEAEEHRRARYQSEAILARLRAIRSDYRRGRPGAAQTTEGCLAALFAELARVDSPSASTSSSPRLRVVSR